MSDAVPIMNRREALARAGYLLGGALSASTVAGVLAGCAVPRGGAADAWRPRTLTPRQAETVLVMGEHIIPETDTPGARAARVDQYIDAMLTDYYSAAERERFLAGLARAEDRAVGTFGRSFLELEPGQQLDLVRALNDRAFPVEGRQPHPLPPANPALQERKATAGELRELPVAERPWDPADVGGRSFFRMLKELVLVGYYTSEVGATQELSVNPMGVWLPDIPYSDIGKSWA